MALIPRLALGVVPPSREAFVPSRNESIALLPPPEPAHDPPRQLLRQGRSALLLRPRIASTLPAEIVVEARSQLDQEMVAIPDGLVTMRGRNWLADQADRESAEPEGERTFVAIDRFLLDRFAVTNRQFAEFVHAGGYEQTSLWDEPVRNVLHELVDQSGQARPRFWRDGTYPDVLSEHPVVGVSWFEAWAYARWVGKRLPTDAEWVKAASWPTVAGRQIEQRRFPWGDLFHPRCANLWDTRLQTTCDVRSLPSGDNPVGARQLVGNVWEWTSTDYGAYDKGADIVSDVVLKSLRGGAYDTYFPQQASWQFQSGDDPLARRPNIGFRCAISACDLLGDPI